MPNKTRRKWSPEQKTAILRRFRASGLSREAFSRKEGIAPSVLSNWLRKESQGKLPAPEPGLVSVKLRPEETDGHQGIEIVLRGGHRIRVGRGFDAEVLEQVIATLTRC